eukprot:g54216.t1
MVSLALQRLLNRESSSVRSHFLANSSLALQRLLSNALRFLPAESARSRLLAMASLALQRLLSTALRFLPGMSSSARSHLSSHGKLGPSKTAKQRPQAVFLPSPTLGPSLGF